MKLLIELLEEQKTEVDRSLNEIRGLIFDLKIKEIKLMKALKNINKQLEDFKTL